MKYRPKTERILFAAAAVVFALLVVVLVGMLFSRQDKKTEGDEKPLVSVSPVPVESAAPQGLKIGGKTVDEESDTFYLAAVVLGAEDRTKLSSLKNLRTLSLVNCGLADVSFLSQLSGLTTLYLSDNAVSDVSPLCSLPGLRTLYLDNNPLSNPEQLSRLQNLTTLSLKGVAVADYVVEDLRAAMPGCSIFDDGVVDAARPLSLGGVDFTAEDTVLDLSGRGISDISRLAYCEKLERLDLSGNPLDGVGVLRELGTLKVLELSGCGLTDDDLGVIMGLRGLTWLNLTGNGELTAEGLEELKEALPNCEVSHDEVHYLITLGGQSFYSNLTDLGLAGVGITDLRDLEKCEALESVNLARNSIADAAPLRNNIHLKSLNLEDNLIVDVNAFGVFQELETLDLSGNRISDITALANCTELKWLDLSGNQLTYISHLALCSKLEWLDLRNNPAVTWDMVEYLRLILPACEILADVTAPTPEPPPLPTPEPTPVPTAEPTPPPATEPPLDPDPVAPV
ncbi:MAG: leucine-rich repeat domain-containing protein [Ruminococcaceae bacterium]|nr:leucine-rich repeat domain-containing protein [Oscillospiraceae bacterium]